MIVSVSRRTDVPAFYAEWFMGRLADGYCLVANPFNKKQVARISLEPEDVDCFVFWSKNPRPLMSRLDELDRRGHRYYFLITLNDYPPELEPGLSALGERLATFGELADAVGPERVVWRYDPIILSNRTDGDYHRRVFDRLAAHLAGRTRRVIVSLVHYYRKTRRRLNALADRGFIFDEAAAGRPETMALLADLAGMARADGMEMMACADGRNLTGIGIEPGRCIDGRLIRELWGGGGSWPKDPGQRPDCGCAASRDIGAPDTCLHDCSYCYATVSPEAARKNNDRHDPASPALVGPRDNRSPLDDNK